MNAIQDGCRCSIAGGVRGDPVAEFPIVKPIGKLTQLDVEIGKNVGPHNRYNM
jgi:hypothetical protein